MMLSKDFFQSDIFQDSNPIYLKIWFWLKVTPSEKFFDIILASSELRIPQKNLFNILLDMQKLGFLDYNIIYSSIRLTKIKGVKQ